MTPRLLLVGFAIGVSLAGEANAQQLPFLPPRAQPAQVKPGTGVIAGQVVTSDNPARPIRKVRVTLNMVGRGMPGKTTTTDDAGRFEFRELPVGRFEIQAYRPDYVRTNYGARRPGRAGTPVSLAEAERRDGIVIPIPRGGVISGIVRDASGTPVPGALVRTLLFGYSGLTGERTLQLQSSGGSVRTDDRGAYRAWGLAAGEYVIKVDMPVEPAAVAIDEMRLVNTADVQRVLADARSSAGGFTATANPSRSSQPLGSPVKYASIYFPATPELASARTVTLEAGEERDGIDVQLQLARTARVEGSVRAPQGAPTGTSNLTMAPTFTNGQPSLGQPDTPRSTSVDRTGRFSFDGIAPGRYTLTAKMPEPAVWWATADIVVDGTDLDIPLDLQPPIIVNGRLMFEGAIEPPKSFAGMRFVLLPPGVGSMIPNESNGGQVDALGQFQIRGVVPATYSWITFGGSNSGDMARWSLKRVMLNGRDASDAPLQVAANENDLVFVYHDQPSELIGTLQDASGRAASEYFVVVFPADKALWTPRSRRIRSVRPSTDGRFSVQGLPAGDYLIAALTDLANGEQNDPSLLASLVSASLKVTLSDGQKTTQDLRLAER